MKTHAQRTQSLYFGLLAAVLAIVIIVVMSHREERAPDPQPIQFVVPQNDKAPAPANGGDGR